MAEVFDESAVEAEAPVERGAAAIAVALDEKRARGRRTDTVDAFLEDQRRLTAAQLSHLHAQFGSLRWRAWAERLKVTLQALTILVGVLALGTVGAIAWNAANDHDLVIDGFSVPPDLAQQGSTGGAVATELHDKLGRLHEDTVTSFSAVAVREKASSDARVEIPETGISLSEVNRLLRDWLGHERHVTGEVAHVAAGPERGALAMNLRVGDEPGVRLVQADGDLEALLAKAAEHVYGSVEPLNYVTWLDQHGRTDEAVVAAKRLATQGDRPERARALGMVAQLQQGKISLQEQRALLAESVELDPGFSMNNLAVTEQTLGLTESALKHYRAAAAWNEKHPESYLTPTSRERGRLRFQANIARSLGDDAGALPVSCFDFQVNPCRLGALVDTVVSGGTASREDTTFELRPAEVASTLLNLHDSTDAGRILAAPAPDVSGRSEAYQLQVAAQRNAALAYLHRVREDWPALIEDYKARDALAAASPAVRSNVTAYRYRPLALAKLGDATGARALAASQPRDCYFCLFAAAEAYEALGDRAAADAAYAEAIRQGPSIPRAEASWGRARLARSDADGALKLAQASYRKSPRFEDASELWGEALLAKGDAKGAAAKFEEAAKLSPRWGRLRMKWGEALAREGTTAGARAQFAQAAALDLTAADRAELAAQERRS